MNKELPEKKGPVKPGTRRYKSVADMMAADGTSHEVREHVEHLAGSTDLTRELVRMRLEAKLTQEQLAQRLGCTQGCVSKWESGSDEDILFRTLVEYVNACDDRMQLSIGKPMSHVEAVRYHAIEMRNSLLALAEAASKDENLVPNIKGFFHEAFFNILDILVRCQSALPKKKDSQFEFRRVKNSSETFESFRRTVTTA